MRTFNLLVDLSFKIEILKLIRSTMEEDTTYMLTL